MFFWYFFLLLIGVWNCQFSFRRFIYIKATSCFCYLPFDPSAFLFSCLEFVNIYSSPCSASSPGPGMPFYFIVGSFTFRPIPVSPFLFTFFYLVLLNKLFFSFPPPPVCPSVQNLLYFFSNVTMGTLPPCMRIICCDNRFQTSFV